MSAPTYYGTGPDGTYGEQVIEGGEDFVSVTSVGEWGYSWHLLEAWYSPSRDRFYWISGSGCSCNSLMDGVSALGDFLDGDRDALIRAVKDEFEDDSPYAAVPKDALAKELHAIRTWRYQPEAAA